MVVITEIDDRNDTQSATTPQPGDAPQTSTSTEAGENVTDEETKECAIKGENRLQVEPAEEFHEAQELSDEEKGHLEEAERRKKEGNALYGQAQYEEAKECYSDALQLAPEICPSRAVYYANRAACELKLEQYSEAAKDCTAALKLDGQYLKALLRRSDAYEHMDDLDRAFEDVKKVLDIEPGNLAAQKTVKRLEPVVMQRREKMKDEMIGKLKDMGNSILGRFGMSLDNFKTEKDPQTGAYSIKFQQ